MQAQRLLLSVLSWVAVQATYAAPPVSDPPPPDATAVATVPDDPGQWRRFALTRALDTADKVDDAYRRAQILAGIASVQVHVDDTQACDRTIRSALAAAEQVTEPAFRSWALHDIVQAQIATDDLLGARQTAERIKAARPQGAALARIADIQIRGGNIDAALATAKKIRDRAAAGEVLRQIVALQAASGELSAALATVRFIDADFYEALALGDIAVARVRKGGGKVHELATRAQRMHRPAIYGRIALARAEHGDMQGADESLRKIDDNLNRALVQGRIALVRATAGDASTARQLFAAALAAVDTVRDRPHRKAVVLAQISRLQSAAGDLPAARETLHRALRNALVLGEDELRDEVLEFIARGQMRSGDFAAALATTAEVGNRAVRALLVRDIVTLQAAGSEALKLASDASQGDALIEAAALFGVLGNQLLKPGQAVSAQTIEAARDAVRRIEDTQVKPAAFAALAAAHARAGADDGSRSIFQESLAAAASMPRDDQRATAYVRIVDALNDRLMFLGQPVQQTADCDEAQRDCGAPEG